MCSFLQVELSIHEFKLNLMGYYEAYENNNLSSLNIPNDTLTLIRNVFTSRRNSLADYLPSIFCVSPQFCTGTISSGIGHNGFKLRHVATTPVDPITLLHDATTPVDPIKLLSK